MKKLSMILGEETGDNAKYQNTEEFQMLSGPMQRDLLDAMEKGEFAIIFKDGKPMDGGKVPEGLHLIKYINSRGDLNDRFVMEYFDSEVAFERAWEDYPKETD